MGAADFCDCRADKGYAPTRAHPDKVPRTLPWRPFDATARLDICLHSECAQVLFGTLPRLSKEEWQEILGLLAADNARMILWCWY